MQFKSLPCLSTRAFRSSTASECILGLPRSWSGGIENWGKKEKKTQKKQKTRLVNVRRTRRRQFSTHLLWATLPFSRCTFTALTLAMPTEHSLFRRMSSSQSGLCKKKHTHTHTITDFRSFPAPPHDYECLRFLVWYRSFAQQKKNPTVISSNLALRNG